MTGYRVQWTAAALRDLAEIIHFIAAENADRALHQLDKIERKAKRLRQYPRRGRIVPELKAIGISGSVSL